MAKSNESVFSSDDLKQNVEHVSDQIREKAEQAKGQAQEYYNDLYSYIKHNPVKSVVFSSLIGAFVGMLITK